MTCALCSSNSHRYNFASDCCFRRWLRGAYKPHAMAWLERYQKNHGREAMLKLIEETKNGQDETHGD